MTDIVLAVDESEARARAQAERLVELGWDSERVTVTVVHSFTDNVEGASISQFGPAREASDILEAAEFEVRLGETSGDPADRIVEYAEDVGADLVCVAGRQRTPAGKAVFGSVSQSVMLEAPMPVLFCSTDAR